MIFSRHSRKIAVSFSIVLALMAIMIVFSLSRMKIMQDKIDVITKEHSIKSKLMMVLRHGIYERQVSLRNIMLMDDPFERDEGKTVFNSYALDMIDARNKFSGMKLSKQERNLLNKMNEAILRAFRAQMKLIDLSIYDVEYNVTQEDLKTAFKSQRDFKDLVRAMIKIQNEETQEAVMASQKSYSDAKKTVFVLGGGALIFGAFVAFFVVRLTSSQEKNIFDAMASIKKSHDEMEQHVEDRTVQLSIARDEALASNKAKDTFIATMSHELRTPLNIIIGYSEIIEEIAEEENIKHIIPDLKKIQSAADHQLKLVSSILDITKLEEGKLDMNPVEFDVETLITEIDNAAKPLMLNNENVFEVNCSHGIGMMYSDNMRIRQILLNLLSNASKFTSQGKISLNIKRNDEGDQIIFDVKDTGLGIPENYIEHLFDKFTQEDTSTTRKYGGSGLGLAISKELAKLLKGDITVQSIKGEGSTFSLYLPIIYTE